jgi:hypothetical protein
VTVSRRVAAALALAALLATPALALGIPTSGNRSGPRFGGWLGIVLLVAVLVAAGLLIAWGLRREGRTPRGRLLTLMREARALVARPDNRFIRSPTASTPLSPTRRGARSRRRTIPASPEL